MPKKLSNKNGKCYQKLPTDEEGFVDANEYSPSDFDICLLKLSTGARYPGWASGSHYDGKRLRPGDEVVAWKKIREGI